MTIEQLFKVWYDLRYDVPFFKLSQEDRENAVDDFLVYVGTNG